MADFSKETILAVWQKAFPQTNNDPAVFRKDYAGAWIQFDKYGDRGSLYGWEIDHLKPVRLGGTDDISNLYPLFWKNNVSKGDSYPDWSTQWSSKGINNIEETKFWHI